MDEAGLLDAGDDLDLDAGLVAGPVEELLGVLGLAHRAGGHGADVGVVRPSAMRAQALEGGDAPVDGVGGRAASCRPPPEPRRTISFSRAMTSNGRRHGAGHDEVHRVRPMSMAATTMWNEFVPMSMAASWAFASRPVDSLPQARPSSLHAGGRRRRTASP